MIKNILTLSYLFVIAFSLSQVRAQEISFNDLSHADLNGHSLREVFENNNIFNNVSLTSQRLYNFQNNQPYVLIPTIINGEHYVEYNLQGYVSANDYIYSNISLIDNLTYSLQINTYAWNGVNYTFERYLLSGLDYKDYSYKRQVLNVYNGDTYLFRMQMYDYQNNSVTFAGDEVSHITVGPNVYINLTALGIDDLTKEQMDYYYNLYVEYKDAYTLDTEGFGFNVFRRFNEMFYLLIDYSALATNFLFTTQTIGFGGVELFGKNMFAFNFKFIPFYSIGTTAIVMTLMYLAKKYIPFL